MEPKEYSVPDFGFRIHSLRILDADGNPIDTSEPVAYKLVAEDGSLLTQGTLNGDNVISLKDVPTRKFRVEFETLDVTETSGFQHISEKGSEAGESAETDR